MAAGVEGPMEVYGLGDAVLLLGRQGGEGLDVVVASVQLRQAPALLQLIDTETKKPGGWKVAHTQKLRQVARFNCEVDAVLDVVVPLLQDQPRSAAGGRLVTRYGWSLRHVARKVDGSNGPFFTAARKVSNAMRRQSHDIREAKGLEALNTSLDKIKNLLVHLQEAVVNLPKIEDDDDEKEEDKDEDEDEDQEEGFKVADDEGEGEA